MRRHLQSYTDNVSVFAWAENVFQMGGSSSEKRDNPVTRIVSSKL